MFTRHKSPTEKILIVGLGGVGFYLAKRLVDEEYAVTIIESDSRLINQATTQIDARLIKGDGMSMNCWRQAEAGDMDYMIAVTDNDAVNMMASIIGHKFGIERKIARIRSLDFGKPDSIVSKRDLHLDLAIYPEELAAQEIVRLIERNSTNEVIETADGEIQVLAAEIDSLSPWAHKDLKTIARGHDSFFFRVVAIARGIKTIIPQGDDELLPDDHVCIMVKKRDLSSLMKLMGLRETKSHKVLILGGGLVGSRVASLLEKSVQVILVEKDEKRAEELVTMLPHTEVLNGDGSDAEVLTMAGLFGADTLVTLTGENETNIMTCLLAKHLIKNQNEYSTVPRTRTVSLVSKEDYLVLASSTGSDIALNKKVMAASEILKYIRGLEFRAVAHLHGFDAEVVELVAAPKSAITTKPLSQLDQYYQDKMIIGGVHRNGSWHIGVGDTVIEGDERVIVVCASRDLKIIRKLFSA